MRHTLICDAYTQREAGEPRFVWVTLGPAEARGLLGLRSIFQRARETNAKVYRLQVWAPDGFFSAGDIDESAGEYEIRSQGWERVLPEGSLGGLLRPERLELATFSVAEDGVTFMANLKHDDAKFESVELSWELIERIFGEAELDLPQLERVG